MTDCPAPGDPPRHSFGGLSVDVAADELRALEQAELEGASPRRWSDAEADAPPKPQLRFERAESMVTAILTDDAKDVMTAGVIAPVLPPGGPQFVGAVPGEAEPLGRFVATSALPANVRRRKAQRARRWRRGSTAVVVIAMLGAGAYAAYPRVRAQIRSRSVPADLRAYVRGAGIAYAPAGQGYSVRLPARPHPRDSADTSPNGARSMFVHRSIVAGADYQIVVRVDEPPNTGTFPLDLSGVLRDPFLVGTGGPTNVRAVVVAGAAGYEADVRTPNVVPFKVAVFAHGTRLYVIRVETRSPGVVLDAVAASFHFTR